MDGDWSAVYGMPWASEPPASVCTEWHRVVSAVCGAVLLHVHWLWWTLIQLCTCPLRVNTTGLPGDRHKGKKV